MPEKRIRIRKKKVVKRVLQKKVLQKKVAQNDVVEQRVAKPLKKLLTKTELAIKWTQQHNTLYLTCKLGKYWFKMPNNWKLSELNPKVLNLIEIIIFRPFWDIDDLNCFIRNESISVEKKSYSECYLDNSSDDEPIFLPDKEFDDLEPDIELESNDLEQDIELESNELESNDLESNDLEPKVLKAAIAFSGGNDSCACVPILPADTVLVYLKRIWNSPRNILKHTQQLKCLANIRRRFKRTAYIIESNIELIARYSIGRVGFSTDYVPVVPALLLTTHEEIGYVCTGTIGVYLKGGYRAQNFLETDHYKFWNTVFREVGGIPLFYPVGGCSDRVTAEICRRNKIPGQPCLRNDDGACNRCFKCFRKNFLIKIDEQSNKDTDPVSIDPILYRAKAILDRNPEIYNRMKQRPMTRIEVKRLGILNGDKDIKPDHLKLDFSFENGYHPAVTRALVPEHLHTILFKGLDKWSRAMTEQELENLEKLDLSNLVL